MSVEDLSVSFRTDDGVVHAVDGISYTVEAGKTLGILGYGHIGQALARRARAFDMEVWATRRRTDAARPEELAFLGGPNQLDEVLRRADYLAVTLSLSETTRNLITERELRLMKPGVIQSETAIETSMSPAIAGARSGFSPEARTLRNAASS